MAPNGNKNDARCFYENKNNSIGHKSILCHFTSVF